MKARYRLWLWILVLALGVPLFMTGSRSVSAAGPWYVAPGGSDSDSCLSPGTACATINGAIAKADPADTVYVAIGTYTGTGDEVVLIDGDVIVSKGGMPP